MGVGVRGKNLKLPIEEVLARARRLVDTGSYSLEQGLNGGNDPTATGPYSHGTVGTADCVGVGMYVQGVDRYQPQIPYYGGWVNTNSVFAMPELFTNLGQDFSKVQPGDVLAYPSYKDILGRKHYGHWMTVEDVMDPKATVETPLGPRKLKRATQLSELMVIHCSQRKAPATKRTPGFAKGKASSWAFFRPTWR